MSINSSSLALPGLSGYDFSGVIQQMVDAYKLPEAQLLNQQTQLKTEKSAWQDVNTRLAALNDSLVNLRMSSSWHALQAVSGNPALLSATVGTGGVAGNYNIQVLNTAQAQTIVSSVQSVAASGSPTTVSAGSFTITVSGTSQTVAVAGGASLADIAAAVNSTQAGVTASVIQVAGGFQLAITSNQTGLSGEATLANVGSGTVLQDLGLADASNNLNVSQAAKDANITVNGITNITSSTNTFTNTIPGVTLNLNGADGGASTVTLNVTADNSVAQKAVQGFVDSYNSAMQTINKYLSYNSDTKQAGALLGDSVLQGIQFRLRSLVTNTVNNPTGPYLTLGSVGVATSSDNFGEDGTLTLDADKFTQALQANPQSVANLFGAPYGSFSPANDLSSTPQGMANVLGAYLDPLVMYGGTLAQTQSGLDNQIKDVTNSIADFDQRASAYEDSLKAKFSDLETLLSQLNSQGSWLSSQIQSMSGSSSKSNG